ncbi:DNA ligase (NAD(+)) LigA [Kineobactrum sediminis]|uniref:DNA ligase n=1 Tax=Kineobactrum sediminis TaxID=1905677 RepID=A0A2N5XYZ7_9GAMM|nr:NAD-dependent DNA ligase LigA [Kineobactrum sediminis]PLW81353.1 DNA ligase (NAD(+)) LigA [Kineobactrum sediminis]
MNFKDKPDTHFKSVDKLDKKEAAEQIDALREGINHHDYLYYVKGSPEISDKVYDKLFNRLEELEAAFPDLQTEDSPTRRVGAEPVSKLKKVTHKAPLFSLQATLEKEDIDSFLTTAQHKAGKDSVQCVLEPKFDGLSVEVVYKNGHFDYGSTRGTGEEGEDISHNLKTIRALPMELQHKDETPASLAIRGEVFMPKDGFMALNKRRIERGETAFSNPRNAAAGIMRQLESRHVADKPLDIIFYEILATEGAQPATHQEVLKQLSRWGLKTCDLNQSASTLKKIEQYHHRLAEERDDLDYEIDGIVIKLDDHDLRNAMGTRDRSPRWALAWKFPPREEITTVEDIVVQVGRTGILTPVALLQPVDIGGVTVSRATLHNEDEVHRKDIRVGDRVRIMRAGDVIPEVDERVKTPGKKRAQEFHMPDRCPVCNAEVTREGAYYVCTAGLACAAQLRGRIQHYAARSAMNIDHLGEQTANQLVERQMVSNLADLYTLAVDDLKSLEGFAETSAKQLHDAIQEAREPRLDRFLFALGLHHVGRRVARQLAEQFHTLDNLMKADQSQIEDIPGIGTETAMETEHFFRDPANRDVIKRMQEQGLKVHPMPRPEKKPLEGKTFVFTGSLENFTRDEAKEQVEMLGARATSSVSNSTDFVVVGSDPGSKRDEAENIGVECIDEKDFEKLINKHGKPAGG